jgi:hypothetical protein
MNERIRELAEQTGYIWHASGDPQVYEFTPEKLDEFAELIVRDVVEQIIIRERNDGEWYQHDIFKHFGVKE